MLMTNVLTRRGAVEVTWDKGLRIAGTPVVEEQVRTLLAKERDWPVPVPMNGTSPFDMERRIPQTDFEVASVLLQHQSDDFVVSISKDLTR